MTRRAADHDYRRPGIYHVTLHAAKAQGKPFGMVIGTGGTSARVMLTPVGSMVEQELLNAITTRYPMVTVDTHVVMPEHLHAILIVRDPIVSANGRPAHLGQVIAGFKQGCNRRFWALTGQAAPTPAAKPPGTLSAAAPALVAPSALPATTVPGGFAAGTLAPTVPGGFAAGAAPAASPKKPRFSSTRAALFDEGYCDVMPIAPGQLDQLRAYIRNNPSSRWLRHSDRERLQPRRGYIATGLTIAALRAYLRRECPAASADVLSAVESRLLIAGGTITCDTYGDRRLLQRRLLPVVCHRCDVSRHAEQMQRCLHEAAQGALLLSPRIASGEQTIIDEALHRGFAVAIIADNGFPDRYHPSTDRINLCAEGRLLIITPWQYRYRGKNEPITVPLCKAMNCVAQALCRLKDDWWKQPVAPIPTPTPAAKPPGTLSAAPAAASPDSTVPGGFAAGTPAPTAAGK